MMYELNSSNKLQYTEIFKIHQTSRPFKLSKELCGYRNNIFLISHNIAPLVNFKYY